MEVAVMLFLGVLLAAAVITGPVIAIVALLQGRQLRARLVALEGAAARRRSPAAEAPRVAPPAPAPPTKKTVAAAPAKRGIDIESLIAGRWLNRIGVIALLLAVGFFLKYAFDNAWIGPAGRIAIGLFAGAALLVYSEFLMRRGYLYFSEGIAGTGSGVLYLSLYAAWGFYDLVPQAAAFVGMLVVTACIAAIAAGRDSQRLSLLALIGGLLTPGLLSTGQDQQFVLFSYLLLLNAGLLLLARSRSWRILEPLALLGSVFYFFSWFHDFYEPSKLLVTLLFASIFFVEFALLGLLRARSEPSLLPEQYAVGIANATWLMITLQITLYKDHRWGLTLAVLLLAAVYFGIRQLLPPEADPTKPSPARLFYSGLALTFVTLTIPIRLEGEWITLAWTIEGALLVWGGFRARVAAMRGSGLVLFVLVVVMLLVQDVDAERVLFNARFATIAAAIAAFATAFFLSRSNREQLQGGEEKLFGVVGIAANLLGVVGLSLEVWDFFGQKGFDIDHRLAQQMGLSILWTVCAVALIVVGVRRASPALRWQGLALFGLAIVKVFFFDLSFLTRVYRILSFFALGLVALIVSFLYQRKLTGDRPGDEP